MIVRVIGEGQFEVGSDALGRLNALDEELQGALEREDARRFAALLREMAALVRAEGKALDFRHGRTLDANRGVVATSGGALHDLVIDAIQRVRGG